MNNNLYDNFVAKQKALPKEYVGWNDPAYTQYAQSNVNLPYGFEVGGNVGRYSPTDEWNREYYLAKNFGNTKALVKRTYENGEEATNVMSQVDTPMGNFRLGTTNRDGSWTPAYGYMKNFDGWGIEADGYRDTDRAWHNNLSIGAPMGEGIIKFTGEFSPDDKRYYSYYERNF